MPEDYCVDGTEKVVERVKLKRINKRKDAKESCQKRKQEKDAMKNVVKKLIQIASQ